MSIKVTCEVKEFTPPGYRHNGVSVPLISSKVLVFGLLILTMGKLSMIEVPFVNRFENSGGYPRFKLSFNLIFGELNSGYVSLQKVFDFVVKGIKAEIRIEVIGPIYSGPINIKKFQDEIYLIEFAPVLTEVRAIIKDRV